VPSKTRKPERADSLSDYRIFETDEFLKKLKKLQTKDQLFIEGKLRARTYTRLREEPHFGKNIKKLKGDHQNIWRYRIGKFRLFYTVNETDKIIYILTIDLRKDAY
jgi:mRNA interferase RelE/StbE